MLKHTLFVLLIISAPLPAFAQEPVPQRREISLPAAQHSAPD